MSRPLLQNTDVFLCGLGLGLCICPMLRVCLGTWVWLIGFAMLLGVAVAAWRRRGAR